VIQRIITGKVYECWGLLVDGVAPRDPLTFVGVVALLVLGAFGASWLPARRATRVDPIPLRSGLSRGDFGWWGEV
jgi:hypothetical protein